MPPDDTTFDYLRDRPFAPKGRAFETAKAEWLALCTDPGAQYDAVVTIDAVSVAPMVIWGTSPEAVASVGGNVPDPDNLDDDAERAQMQRMLDYMGLEAGQALIGLPIDVAFIGSCTNRSRPQGHTA